MSTIKFNNATFTLESFNKNTYFGGETITSTANCVILNEDPTDLMALANTPITSIQIYREQELIYNSQNINAHLDNTNEFYDGNRMVVSIGLTFDIE